MDINLQGGKERCDVVLDDGGQLLACGSVIALASRGRALPETR